MENISRVPKSELDERLIRFKSEMNSSHETWEICGITGAASLFYLTGTICDGLLLMNRYGDDTLWVRRSYQRSSLESEFADIREMTSFRNVAEAVSFVPETIYLDMSHATLEWYGLLTKHLPFKSVQSNDNALMNARAIKSEYELERLRIAGDKVNRILTEEMQSIVYDNISESILGANLLAEFIRNGHHGISRFNMRNSAELLGHIAFGDGALYPGVFNGASGIAGLYPATPALGRHTRNLASGDLIYIDVCFGIEGYHVDKTLIFSYKQPQSDEVHAAHSHCLELETAAAQMLRPGVKPSEVYEKVFSMVKPIYLDCFMGAKGRTVQFLGHSVGLTVDETPVLAKGFDAPLERNMVIAIEPKIGLDGIGMVGSENTYIVTDTGGVSLTGSASDMILLK